MQVSRGRTTRALGVAATVLYVGGSGVAFAGEASSETCDGAFTKGQRLRKEGRLSEALDALEACRDVECDAVVRKLCREEADEITTAMPSVLVVVEDATGSETIDFSLSVDGEPYEGRVDRAIELDPGERTLTARIEGKPPEKKRIVAREGEKKRRVSFDFSSEREGTTDAPPPDAGGEPDAGLTGVQIGGIAVGALGLAGLGATTGLGIWALDKGSEAEALCPDGPDEPCDDFDNNRALNDDARTLRNAAIATGIVGGAALVAGVTMLIAGGSDDAEPAATGAALVVGPPGFVGVRGRF